MFKIAHLHYHVKFIVCNTNQVNNLKSSTLYSNEALNIIICFRNNLTQNVKHFKVVSQSPVFSALCSIGFRSTKFLITTISSGTAHPATGVDMLYQEMPKPSLEIIVKRTFHTQTMSCNIYCDQP